MARPRGKRQDKKKEPGLVVAGFISPGQVYAGFTVSLATNAVNEPRLKGFSSGGSARINRARNEIIRNFIGANDAYEWFWMVDADMILPPDALTVLLNTAETQGRKLVGGLGYIYKPEAKVRYLASIMHKVDPGDDIKFVGEEMEQYIINEPPRRRFIEATSTGFFCMLMHRSVLEAMQEMYAHYNNPWIDEMEQGSENSPKGPDVEFYERAKAATGETPLIDTSVQCGHIKQFTITHEQALQYYHGEKWEDFLGFIDE